MTSFPGKNTQASTVVLVRDHESGFQVYLLKRSQGSGFFPGYYVFPGGRIGPEDRNAEVWGRYSDLDERGVEERLGGNLPAAEAIAYAVAAIRETFEEAGFLLAEPASDRGSAMQAICEMRRTAPLSESWLREWTESHSGRLSMSRLLRWAHWITPEALKPRFDTRFYLVLVAPTQECSPDRKETTHGIWVTPRRALTANLAAQMPLSPPTLVTLQELLHHHTANGLLDSAGRLGWGEPRVPRFVGLGKDALILEPWDPMVHEKDLHIDQGSFEEKLLPVGEPFSRLWLSEGIWRPVRR